MNEIKKLVSSAKQGCQSAFDRLYELTNSEIWYTCVSLLKNEENAKDTMQNTYITAFLKLDTLENEEKFCGWVKSIAVNKCKDFFKGKAEYQIDEEVLKDEIETDEVMLPEEYVTNTEKRKIILQLMEETLSYAQYQTVFMFYFDEMTIGEIAGILEISEGTVKSRLNSSRAKIKQAVIDYENKSEDKLHGVVLIPLFPSVFKAQAESLEVPMIDITIPTSAGQITVLSKGAEGAVKATAKTASSILKTKVIASICAVAAFGSATVGSAFLSGFTVKASTADSDESKETIMFGDVNSDNVINLKDAIETQKYSLNFKDFNDTQKLCGDVDKNGKVNLLDSILLQKFVLGIDSENIGIGEEMTQPEPTDPITDPSEPTDDPATKPTEKPTQAPTKKPTQKPTEKPTQAPTQKPTQKPTQPATEKPTEKPTQKRWVPAKTETQKTWIPAKTETKVIHHDAVTHEEPVYKTGYVSICNTCGADITGFEGAHGKQHAFNGENASHHEEYVKVQTGTKTVVDKEAWDETVTVTVEEGHWETKTVVVEEGHWEYY